MADRSCVATVVGQVISPTDNEFIESEEEDRYIDHQYDSCRPFEPPLPDQLNINHNPSLAKPLKIHRTDSVPPSNSQLVSGRLMMFITDS